MGILGIVFLPIYFLVGSSAIAFTSVHLPIQLVGRVVDLSEARIALCAAALFHWVALLSVAFGISWMQSSPSRAYIADLLIYVLAQFALMKSYELLGTEKTLALKPSVTVGRLKLAVALCGLALLIPGGFLVLSILGVKL